jgi:hypothetical protein
VDHGLPAKLGALPQHNISDCGGMEAQHSIRTKSEATTIGKKKLSYKLFSAHLVIRLSAKDMGRLPAPTGSKVAAKD